MSDFAVRKDQAKFWFSRVVEISHPAHPWIPHGPTPLSLAPAARTYTLDPAQPGPARPRWPRLARMHHPTLTRPSLLLCSPFLMLISLRIPPRAFALPIMATSCLSLDARALLRRGGIRRRARMALRLSSRWPVTLRRRQRPDGARYTSAPAASHSGKAGAQ
jgi:hypothetical protein